MLPIGLVGLLHLPWDRRVVLGIFPVFPVLAGYDLFFAEYNSALPGGPK
uniref:Uncharacterized protein n=1 Tax=Candidatus Kentrum sp. FW TaxID=2126338 RepID=A0A450RZN9_9GAMM|nr:MAG: hypothetical protein BECKFW1821A_GA0114235_100814 [Candidatus Kentron sp. FW]VFJ44739.1 MAG: hypothetical protein BECKFW1821A_GA0114235_100815 [Candidatus Kentron sp. FW]